MAHVLRGFGFIAVATSLALSACDLGESKAAVANAVPAVSSPPTNLPAANLPPVIGGTPGTAVQASSPYSFTPNASDADGDALSFSITGKPAWAIFSAATGQLTGTPATVQAGTYSNIVITVNDGKVSASLPAFAISVTSTPTTAIGTASLSWSAPTQNTDGSALTNLGGYRIYHGTSAKSLGDVRTVSNASTRSYQFTALASGTHYFSITAYNTDGVESAASVVGSKTIP